MSGSKFPAAVVTGGRVRVGADPGTYLFPPVKGSKLLDELEELPCEPPGMYRLPPVMNKRSLVFIIR